MPEISFRVLSNRFKHILFSNTNGLFDPIDKVMWIVGIHDNE